MTLPGKPQVRGGEFRYIYLLDDFLTRVSLSVLYDGVCVSEETNTFAVSQHKEPLNNIWLHENQQVNSPENNSQSVEPDCGISWFTVWWLFSQKLKQKTNFGFSSAHCAPTREQKRQTLRNSADLLQSHDLHSTQITETLCDLVQRKTTQDQSRTCAGDLKQTARVL